MPRKKSESKKRSAKGQDSVVQRTINKNGQKYTFYRARFYIQNPDTGLLEQKETSAPTEKEAIAKMREIQRSVENGTYQPKPSQLTLGQWLDEWSNNYLNSVKARTVESYKSNISNHFKPSPISKVKLTALTPIQIQKLYNSLRNRTTGEKLSPKTMKNVHGCLHRALQKAVDLGLIRSNPADKADLPKVIPPEIMPLDETDIENFLKEIQGSEYADIFTVTLFLGLREGEACGMTWDEVDFTNGTVTIKHQLQKRRGTGGEYQITSPKNSKARTIHPAPSIMKLLEAIKRKQFLQMQEVSEIWSNELGFVFTHSDGSHFCPQTVYLKFKDIARRIGRPDARFHDLRHSYAVQSLRNGDDIRTLQENLGHHTAAFTLQTYAHATEQMKKDSASRMEAFITGKSFKIG